MAATLGSNSSRRDCSPLVDDVFGPTVDNCARPFDFTLLFEEAILSILPSAIFIILALFRLLVLSTRKPKIEGFFLRTIKLLIIGVLLVICVVIVALWSLDGTVSQRSRASIPAAVLNVVECIIFMALSFMEHSKSIGPPLLLDSYLLITIIFDAVRVRTLWLKNTQLSISILFTATVIIKLGILVLEEFGKRKWLLPDKKPSDKEVAGGIFSRTLFAWLDRMMWSGYSSALTVRSLPDIDDNLLSESIWGRIGAKLEEPSEGMKQSLLWTAFWALKWQVLAPVIPYLVLVASQLAQPYLISTVLDYVGSPYDGSQDQRNIGYGLIAAYGLVYICIAVSTAWGQHLSYRFVVMLRAILVTAIYRKTMSMNISIAEDASAVTLMSTDVERIVLGMARLHDAWSTLVQVGCAMYILYGQVGVVFIAPIVISIVCSFAAIGLSSFAGAFQAGWMVALEKRVAITSSLLGSVKGVKMLGWTSKVSEIIQHLRLVEIASARKFRLMLLAVVTVSFVPVTLAPVATFGIFSAKSQSEIGTALGSNRIFTTLSLLSLITQPLDLLFAYLPEILAAFACFSRIQDYLWQKSLTKAQYLEIPASNPHLSASSSDNDEKTLLSGEAIKFEKASFGWTSETGPVLSSIDLNIPSAKLTMIIGPIASGKSTLLKGILGETPISTGSIQVFSRSVAFCDQNPWLINETLRTNITGSAYFDASWYAEVVRACALEDDIARFPNGDLTVIGSNGMSLSGGQKQRVAIARAVYAKRELLLLDDVFSGLDMETQARIMRDVFGPRGLLNSHGTTTLFVTHARHLLTHADFIVAFNSNGCIFKQGLPDNFKETSLDFLARTGSKDSIEKAGDNNNPVNEPTQPGPTHPEPPSLPNTIDEEAQRVGDSSVYKYYFQTFGQQKTVIFFALQISLVFCLKFPEIILSWWGDSNDREPNVYNGKYLGIFSALEVAALISLLLTCWHVLLNLAVTSGAKLHLALLKSTFRAPLSFFSVTDTGSITNRFSQDISLIDAELPFSLINFVCNGLTCIAQALMIIPASPWLLIGYPILFGGLWFLQRFYLRTSRQLRFLDLDAKSPVYTQFLETLSGLATIRAFGWQKDLIAKADERLDFSQKPFYLLYSIQRWLNLVLDLIVACLAVVLIAIAICLRNSTSVGFAGVALFNIMNLSAALKSAINSWTMLETSIGAVARVKNFTESTPDENLTHESQQPSETWPKSGRIEFNNVSASYMDDDERPVISGISLTINDGDKIGVCGRSGSGKSSMLMALFHLINYEGAISVDGVDISCIPRELLRQRLTTVPQDAVFLAGSIRLNCDPDGCASDENIIEVLRTVQLWDVIEAKGGLDAEVSNNIFSKGQQQIFSLARALLNHSKIVVMDEASSSLDTESEELIMALLRDKFKHTTVISVAHRLNTIMDFDRVLLLDNGKIIEIGNPRELLTRPSAFRSLYESDFAIN